MPVPPSVCRLRSDAQEPVHDADGAQNVRTSSSPGDDRDDDHAWRRAAPGGWSEKNAAAGRDASSDDDRRPRARSRGCAGRRSLRSAARRPRTSGSAAPRTRSGTGPANTRNEVRRTGRRQPRRGSPSRRRRSRSRAAQHEDREEHDQARSGSTGPRPAPRTGPASDRACRGPAGRAAPRRPAARVGMPTVNSGERGARCAGRSGTRRRSATSRSSRPTVVIRVRNSLRMSCIPLRIRWPSSTAGASAANESLREDEVRHAAGRLAAAAHRDRPGSPS